MIVGATGESPAYEAEVDWSGSLAQIDLSPEHALGWARACVDNARADWQRTSPDAPKHELASGRVEMALNEWMWQLLDGWPSLLGESLSLLAANVVIPSLTLVNGVLHAATLRIIVSGANVTAIRALPVDVELIDDLPSMGLLAPSPQDFDVVANRSPHLPAVSVLGTDSLRSLVNPKHDLGADDPVPASPDELPSSLPARQCFEGGNVVEFKTDSIAPRRRHALPGFMILPHPGVSEVRVNWTLTDSDLRYSTKGERILVVAEPPWTWEDLGIPSRLHGGPWRLHP